MNSVEWLSHLIAFDTTSRNSNMHLIEEVEAWFKQHKIDSRLVRSPTENKANLFATIPAANGQTTGGLILSGHTDVVPVDGQAWDINPFLAIEKDNRIYGRGACDMKGFIAVALSLVPDIQKMKLAKPIHFALSYDEEIGCRGAPYMIDALLREGVQAEACIVGEPTDMFPVVAHKGIQVFRCHLQGLAAHSSLTPHACNAIEHAAELICYLRSLADEMKEIGPFDHDFDVPHTTLSTNMIQGGIAHNTIPADCELFFEFRNLPAVSPADINYQINQFIKHKLEPKMQLEYAKASVALDQIATAPGFESSMNANIVSIARELLEDQSNHKVAYATEAGLFQNAHIPTIVCGPGNIEQAHRANEYVEIAQLKKCEAFLREMVVAIGS